MFDKPITKGIQMATEATVVVDEDAFDQGHRLGLQGSTQMVGHFPRLFVDQWLYELNASQLG